MSTHIVYGARVSIDDWNDVYMKRIHQKYEEEVAEKDTTDVVNELVFLESHSYWNGGSDRFVVVGTPIQQLEHNMSMKLSQRGTVDSNDAITLRQFLDRNFERFGSLDYWICSVM